MENINEKTLQYNSMPLHNPLYKVGPVSFRANIIKAGVAIEKPEVIADIVPGPLMYNDNKIFIVLLDVKELNEGFSDEDTLWNEIVIQIPVMYNGEPGLFVCENYCTDIRGVLSARETYGYPKVPCRILMDKHDKVVAAKLFKLGSNREMMNFTCTISDDTPLPEGPPPGGMNNKMPRIILLKYIPSATPGSKPDVKQLIAMKYNKPVIHKIMKAEGNIEILEGAPDYLKRSGITNTVGMSCLDMETNVAGGEVLYDYNS